MPHAMSLWGHSFLELLWGQERSTRGWKLGLTPTLLLNFRDLWPSYSPFTQAAGGRENTTIPEKISNPIYEIEIFNLI